MYNQILVPTDGSPAAEWAAKTAVKLAEDCETTIHAVYVVDTTSSMGHYDAYIEDREREGEHAVEAIETHVRARAADRDVEVAVTKAFRYDTSHKGILGYAADHGIDLIVLGAQRRTGIARFIHPPSAVKRVVRHADVPVLVVRGDAQVFETTAEA